LRCPVCKEEMIVLELEDVEIDYCYSCGGIWLDAGELDLLLGSSHFREERLNSFKKVKTKEKKRNCPICSKKMAKIQVGIDNKVILDICKKNHGLWFDLGELEEVLRIGQLDKNSDIFKLLLNMFYNLVKNPEFKWR